MMAINIRLGLGTRVVIFPFVGFESNMADIFHDTCFIDSRSTIHISNTKIGRASCRERV